MGEFCPLKSQMVNVGIFFLQVVGNFELDLTSIYVYDLFYNYVAEVSTV